MSVKQEPGPAYRLLSRQSKWCRGMEGQDENGDWCDPNSSDCVARCAIGALEKAYPNDRSLVAAGSRLAKVIKRQTHGKHCCVEDYNDDKSTTFADIRRMMKLAKV